MITIASLLDCTANKKTKVIWSLLEKECSLLKINTVPHPHFSWLTAGDIPFEKILDKIKQFDGDPFIVETSGLGIFTGETPVIYLPIIKTHKLLQLHAKIWSEITPFSSHINHHYAPENWMPHITIAFGDEEPEKLICAIGNLITMDLFLSITVDNFAVLSLFEGKANIEFVITSAK